MTRKELVNAIKEYLDDETVEVLDADTIADYLIGKGVRVAPLNEGDTVFVVDPFKKTVKERIVGECDEVIKNIDLLASEDEVASSHCFSSIGFDIFLSREEAEKRLKRLIDIGFVWW